MATTTQAVVPFPPPRRTGNDAQDIAALMDWVWGFYRQTIEDGYVPPTTDVTTDNVTASDNVSVTSGGDTYVSISLDTVLGGVLRLFNPRTEKSVYLYVTDDTELGVVDSDGNGYLQIFNATANKAIKIRSDVGGELSIVSDDDYELLQVDQDGQIQSQGPVQVTVSASTDYTLTATDRGCWIKFTSATPLSVHVPQDFLTMLKSSVVIIEQAGTGQLTFVGDGTVTISNYSSHTKTAGQYAVVFLKQDADDPNVWNLVGKTGA